MAPKVEAGNLFNVIVIILDIITYKNSMSININIDVYFVGMGFIGCCSLSKQNYDINIA